MKMKSCQKCGLPMLYEIKWIGYRSKEIYKCVNHNCNHEEEIKNE